MIWITPVGPTKSQLVDSETLSARKVILFDVFILKARSKQMDGSKEQVTYLKNILYIACWQLCFWRKLIVHLFAP